MEVLFHDKEEELVEYSAKANFRVLGKELGASMKQAAGVIEKLSSSEIQSILEGATLSIEVDGTHLELTTEKIVVNREEKENLRVVNEGTLTVALDTGITPELLQEGAVRDLVRGVQNLRKERGLEVTDRIELTVSATGADATLAEAFDHFREYVMNETLAVSARWIDTAPEGAATIESGESSWEADIVRVSE